MIGMMSKMLLDWFKIGSLKNGNKKPRIQKYGFHSLVTTFVDRLEMNRWMNWWFETMNEVSDWRRAAAKKLCTIWSCIDEDPSNDRVFFFWKTAMVEASRSSWRTNVGGKNMRRYPWRKCRWYFFYLFYLNLFNLK